MFYKPNKKLNTGVSLIEAVVGIGIIVIAMLGIISAYQYFLKSGLANTEKIQAVFLLEEGIEVMRYLRDDSWSNISNLSTTTNYYLNFSGTNWSTTTTPTPVFIFTRTVSLSDVYRKDSDDTIVASSSSEAKTFDPNTRLITISVSYPLSGDMTLSTYLSDIFNN